jgi:mycothiol system anti-sigma-R factor
MSCGNPHETDCGEVLRRLYEYLDGELTTHDLGRIRQHLVECGPCLSEHHLDAALQALLRRSCAGESAPQALRARIMVQITQIRVQLEG